MYKLVKVKKSDRLLDFDYVFDNFNDFYAIADFLSYPLLGVYKIAIKSTKMEEISSFITNQDNYALFDTTIYTAQAIIDNLQAYDQTVRSEEVSMYDVLIDMIKSKNLLFDKGAISAFYSSVEHTVEMMEEMLMQIIEEYGSETVITEKMLSSIMVVNKFIYPRAVLIAYLKMSYRRRDMLETSISQFGDSLVANAMKKNIKIIFKNKVDMIRTGKESKLLRSISMSNIVHMYNVLLYNNFSEPRILMELYERKDLNGLLQQGIFSTD